MLCNKSLGGSFGASGLLATLFLSKDAIMGLFEDVYFHVFCISSGRMILRKYQRVINISSI